MSKFLNTYRSIIMLLLIGLTAWYSLYFAVPRLEFSENSDLTQFSNKKALVHIKELSKKPHYTGSPSHSEIQSYLFQSLKSLNLNPTIQEGFAVSKTGSCALVKNIVAKIPGRSTKNGILLLSHYDSAPHSSYGASDAGSGVATILEGIRAYQASGKKPENTIYICFTDGEELGLLGARLFVEEHPWLQYIKLVFNFEARGSGGGSFMLVETNQKNSNLIEQFKKSNPSHPIANSLAYSVYKMLPNDTDLSIFKEHANIDGFNFAFIDNHYDYHTARDTYKNVHPATLAHQGTYITSILRHFDNLQPLILKSDRDVIYFDMPFIGLISYGAIWILPFAICISILYGLLVVLFIRKKLISIKEIIISLGFILAAIAVSGVLPYFFWKILLLIYPHYAEIQHGFTYNGIWYIFTSICIATGIFFISCQNRFKTGKITGIYIAAGLIWLLISWLTIGFLEGASYFIWIVLLIFINLVVLFYKKHISPYLLLLLNIPGIFIIAPFIYRLPVALGLQMLFLCGILTVLLLSFLIPVFSPLNKMSTILKGIGIALLFLIGGAHYQSGFDNTAQKPNSLLHITDAKTKNSVWATYDKQLDRWTNRFIDINNSNATYFNQNTIGNKYGIRLNYVSPAPSVPFTPLEIYKIKDTIIAQMREVSLEIRFDKTLDRLDIYTDSIINFHSLQINDKTARDFTYKNGKTYHPFSKRWTKSLATFYNTNTKKLTLDFTLKDAYFPTFTFYKSQYALVDHPDLNVSKREDWMIPKPFVLNDAIILKQKVNPDTLPIFKISQSKHSMQINSNERTN